MVSDYKTNDIAEVSKKNDFMSYIMNKARKWLSNLYDAERRQEVKVLMESDSDRLADTFYKDIEFGTGGMRGVMGVGTNRMNKYTIRTTTLGLARYLKKLYSEKPLSVTIAYDVRRNSDIFSRTVASVLSSKRIKVYLFEGFQPTPELSYAVRQLGCQAGIVLTASHNPAEYNGYKVYGEDGAQVSPSEERKIMDEVKNVRLEDLSFKVDETMIHPIGKEMDKAFIKACVEQASFTSEGKDSLKIVFTPLHGASVAITPKAFRQSGFEKVFLVEEQVVPDGDFSTVASPNPEDTEALSMAIALAQECQADIVLGADPDAESLRVAVRNEEGNMIFLNSNQTNTLLVHYLLERWKERGKLTNQSFITSTIVSSDIFF